VTNSTYYRFARVSVRAEYGVWMPVVYAEQVRVEARDPPIMFWYFRSSEDDATLSKTS